MTGLQILIGRRSGWSAVTVVMAWWDLKQGVHPKIVQERLGHSTVGITLDTYTHVVPGLQQAAAAKFDDIIHINSFISV